MFRNIGTVELIIILIVLILLFGAKKIPQFAKSLGEAGTEFRKGFKGENDDKKKTAKKRRTPGRRVFRPILIINNILSEAIIVVIAIN